MSKIFTFFFQIVSVAFFLAIFLVANGISQNVIGVWQGLKYCFWFFVGMIVFGKLAVNS